MADNSTTFDIDIDVRSDTVESAAEKLAKMADRMTATSAAAKQASEAVRAAEAAYRVTEGTADRTAKALEKINIAAEEQAKALRAAADVGDVKGAERAYNALQKLSARQAEAEVKARAAAAAVHAEAAELDRLRAVAAGAAADESKMVKSLEAAKKAEAAVKKAAAESQGTGKVNEIAEAMGKLGGPLGKIGQVGFGAADGIKKLTSSLGSAGPYVAIAVGVAAIVAAIVAVGVAAVVATAKVAAWAVSLADAARTQHLLAEGVAGSVAGGRALDAQIDALTTKVPLAREDLLQMALELRKTGLEGTALAKALDDAAVKAATAKFGPNFAKQLLSLDSQSARFKKNVAGLFGGLQIEGLLAALQHLIGLFDETSASGRAIKVVFESLFQPMIDGATKLEPLIARAFIKLEIWALRALIAIKPHSEQILRFAEALGVVAAVIVGVAAVAFTVLITPLLVLAGLTAAAIEACYQLGAALSSVASTITSSVGNALQWLEDRLDAVVQFFESHSFYEIGSMLVQGLIDGIVGKGQAVVDSVTGIANGAVDAAKRALGIASPSRVFAEIGVHTAAGFSQGIDQGMPDAQSSIESLTSPEPAQLGAGSSSSSGSGGEITIAPGAFVFHGVAGAEDAVGLFTEALERLAAQIGVAHA